MSERQSGRSGDDETIINIRVKALDDSETIVNISTGETIQTLVDRGRSQLNITAGSQRIIFQGRVLDPTHTIQSAGILNGHAVHLVNRTPGGRNDSPNTLFERMRVFPGFPIDAEQFFRRPVRMHVPERADRDSDSNVAITLLPPIRVPAAVSTTPVLASHFNRDIIRVQTETHPHPPRGIHYRTRDLNTAPFNEDPHSIKWVFRVIDTPFSRDAVPDAVLEAIRSMSYISSDVKSQIVRTWIDGLRSYIIAFPRIEPHIPSPALEKLDFLCFWTDFLLDFVAIVEEPQGLISIVREVLEMARNNQIDDGLSTIESERRMTKLDDVIRNLELLSTGLSHMKDYERDRFKKHNTEEYRSRKIEFHAESNNNPPFFMRHAVDVDMTEALRKFRAVRDKISTLETLMDELMEAGALKFARDRQSNTRDYRYQAISVFFHYMQRARHQLAHATHLSSELNVCFLTPSPLQRLLPQYANNMMLIPYGHPATIVLQFVSPSTTDDPFSVPISQIMEPPRRFSDVGDRVNGDWPYLPFNPPSVHMEAAVSPHRRVVDPRVRIGRSDRSTIVAPTPAQGSIDVNDRTAFLAAIDPNTGLTVNDMLQHQQQELEMFIGRIPGIDGSRVRVQARPVRRVVTTGDAPSVPVETLPPPMEVRVVNRFNVHPQARGVETATLSGLPVHMEPNELQRIARNIASRYRPEALRRIAASLAERFRQENWDTRIDTMPLCTLRECVTVALETLTSAGANVNESKDLMLALVRDEEVFIRAIAECFKSLFGRGEFPTHVARIIMPRTEVASARNDYEDVDNLEGADELEAMMVRMPSDVSQPASGDLRAIRNQRDTRRARREAAASASSPTLGASTSSPGPSTSSASATNPPGPSFGPEDMNEIRAGRLPGQSRRRVREAVFPQPSGPPQMLPNRPESPNNITVTFHAHSHYFMPMPPGSGPGPSTSSAGSQTPQMMRAGASESNSSSNSASITSSPASPNPTPRRTSAPPTVASSPTRGAGNSEDAVEEVPRSSEAVRAARAHIDMLAANFTGQLPFLRPPNPASEDTQARTRPVEIPVINTRPMIAIDPFMACNHQQCEINRLQTPDAQPDSHRLNLQSLQPDPELANHLTIQNLRPTHPRRGQRVSTTDEDYNYEVIRTAAGEMIFEHIEPFTKFVRTAIRSLLAHCIDSDSLLTMNMNPISGYVAANHTELTNMVRRNVHHPPYSRFNQTEEPRDETRMQELRARNDEFTRELLAQAAEQHAQMRNGQVRARQEQRPQGIYRIPAWTTIRSSVDTDLSYLPDYIRNPSNPRPSGFFGLVFDMMRGRFDSREVILLTRRNNQILGRYLEAMREQLISTVLDGNRERLSNAEMHRIAESVANEESFFQLFLDRHPDLPRTFNLDDNPEDPVPLAWMFRQIEITVIKALITLALYALRNPTTETHVAGVISAYLARNLMVFWLIANRDSTQQIAYALQLSTFVASIRFRGEHPEGYLLFVQSWDRMITYWYNNYNANPDCTEPLFFDYIRASRAGTDWNDVQVDPNAMPSSATRTSSTSNNGAVGAGAVNPVNPRKRNRRGDLEENDGVGATPMTSTTSSGEPPASKPPRQPVD